ncbi:MAG: hypothetical protein ACT4OS_06125 [Acidimicrobiales bacterium]
MDGRWVRGASYGERLVRLGPFTHQGSHELEGATHPTAARGWAGAAALGGRGER